MPAPPASPVYRNAAALVVGVGDYTDAAIPKLPCPAEDAKALHEVLIDPDVCGFDPAKVLLLTESQATAEAIREAMKVRLPKISAGAELVIIYFSGHGDRDRIGETVEGYLLPVGARRSDIEGTGIAMSRIQTYIDALKADTVLVMLDCCHAAHYLTRDPDPGGGAVAKAIELGPTLMPEMKGGGRFLIASCDKDERSLEIPQLKRGLFTHHLIEGMRGGATRNAKGQIGINSLFDHVARRVADESKRIYGEQQTPRCKGEHTGDAIVSHPALSQPAPGPKPAENPWADLWDRLKGNAFFDEVSTRLDAESESSLRLLIHFAARRKDARFVPLLLGLRDHRDKSTRDRASRALNRFGWAKIRGAVLEPQGVRRDGDFGWILAGLNKYEPDDNLFDLIREVNRVLPADLRVRGIRLLERKRLERDRDRIQTIFREHKRPLLFKQVLGAGLFAGAYLIEHEETKAQLTLRVLRSEFVDLPDVPRRFLEVAGRAMGLEDHQNLASTTECQAFEGHKTTSSCANSSTV